MKLSARQREALDCLDAVPEALLTGSGAWKEFRFGDGHVCFLKDAERLAKRKLCLIEKVGESVFVKITNKGRAVVSPRDRDRVEDHK